MAQFELRSLGKEYRRGKQSVRVLSDLNLSIEAGGFLAIMGPSGSGKSTLLNLLSGIDRPSSGQLLFDGRDLGTMNETALAQWRARQVGFVFQFYHLVPVLNARQNVELPLLLTKLSSAERRKRVERVLELVGMSDRAGHKPRELSGGQQQRVAIARAIVSDPSVIICDEPTGDLDRTTSVAIMELIRDCNAQLGKTVVLVTHDPAAAAYAGRVIHLEKALSGESGSANA